MLNVIVASTNPVKIDAVRCAFEAIFGQDKCQIEGIEVNSGVADQPLGDKETRTGARQRVMAVRSVRCQADFWVGIEAGIDDNMTFSWVVIENARYRGESRSASLSLPPIIQASIRQGQTLGEAMEKVTGVANLGQQGGAIGYFTENLLCRRSVYEQAILLALAPVRSDVYQEPCAVINLA